MVELTRRGFLYGLAGTVLSARFVPSLLHYAQRGVPIPIEKITAPLQEPLVEIGHMQAANVGEVHFLRRGLYGLCKSSGITPVNYQLSMVRDLINISHAGDHIKYLPPPPETNLEGDVPLDAFIMESLLEGKPRTFILPYAEDGFVMGEFIITHLGRTEGI